MSKQLQHKSRWKRFKNMNKRRVNMFLQEKRVANLEKKLAGEVELARLNSEQIDDLLCELERKVEWIVLSNENLKTRVAKLEKRAGEKSLLARFGKAMTRKRQP